MTLIIGLTGGIGSGKSAASEHFVSLGVTVVDADQVAREVVGLGKPALVAITDHFGQRMLLTDGTLDRARLRERIFADADAKQWLESLLHPLIRQEITAQLAAVDAPYAILVSPLLFETGQNSMTDHTLVIDCDEATQQQRVQVRDGNTPKQIQAIMASQLSREERNRRADKIIVNNGSLDVLHQAIDDYHQQLCTGITPQEAPK
jgi:dephospho-CoA kinase